MLNKYCNLRSSGSEISKMQEEIRRLCLSVDVTGRRVKGEDFMLNCIVDKKSERMSDVIKGIIENVNNE